MKDMIATTADGVSSFIALVNKTQNQKHKSFNETYKHLEHLDKKPKLATKEGDKDEERISGTSDSENTDEESSSSSDDSENGEKSSE